MPPVRVSLTAFSVVAALVYAATTVAAQTPRLERARHRDRDLPPLKYADEAPLCDLDGRRVGRQGLSGTGTGMSYGEPLSFLQDPAILRPDHLGSVGLTEFVLVGDYPTLVFEREDPNAATAVVVETWERIGTATVSGQSVSVFQPRWSRQVWSERLRHERFGFDRPYVFWGRVVVPSANGDPAAPPETRSLYLRVGSTGIPTSHVRQIAPDVQYASHVVNLVMPDFGDSRVSSGTYGFDLQTAAHAFFAHFADDYDSIAFIPQRSHMAPFGAFHRNVKNEVAGIGKPLLDQSHAYGSAGRL